jgi:hypothetical protein
MIHRAPEYLNFVDIQGKLIAHSKIIITHTFLGIQGKDRSSGRSQGANTLTLFDLMAHRQLKSNKLYLHSM